MKRLKLYSFIKTFFRSSASETYILISGGLTGFFIIFIINAVLGIYSVFGTSRDLSENYMGINMARSAQVELHKQVKAWENILLSGGRYPDFQNSFLEFSQSSEKFRNLLFNIRLQNPDVDKIHEGIENLLIAHKKMSLEFSGHIADMENSAFRNTDEKISITRGIENVLLDSLAEITASIEESGSTRSIFIRTRYIVIVTLSSIMFISLIVYYGRRIGRMLLKTNEILESMVLERTREYVEANVSLKKEIEEHEITWRQLLVTKMEVEEKNRHLTVSEKKYRLIVEGTSDIIFTLDREWNFKSANDSVKTHLRINTESVNRFRLTDLVYDELTNATILRRIITEKLEESKAENKPLKFNTHLKTANMIEPVEFRISLEFIEFEGSSEIIGKAVRLSDESFSESFISEKSEYMIRNLLFEADDISHRITNNLQKYISKPEINMLRIGLREIIINSIEHGNLNISFDEKTEAIMSDKYFEFINEKQSNPDCREKRVKIEYMITPDRAVYKITDQGRGFNYKRYLAGISSDSPDLALTHGRGIAMVKSIFDEVRYNTRGNQVLLVKHINKSEYQVRDENEIEFAQMRQTEVS